MIGLLFNYRAMAAGHGSFLVKKKRVWKKLQFFHTLFSIFRIDDLNYLNFKTYKSISLLCAENILTSSQTKLPSLLLLRDQDYRQAYFHLIFVHFADW